MLQEGFSFDCNCPSCASYENEQPLTRLIILTGNTIEFCTW
jgi:hypothetical protein